MEAEALRVPYERRVDRAHRDRFGQFFTPPNVADFLVRWVLGNGATELFDPAVGTGAFQKSALKQFPGVFLTGCEKDDAVRSYFLQTPAGKRTKIIGHDYFDTTLDDVHAIVCNPPYLRFQNFEGRSRVISALSAEYGVRFSGYLNAASAFLLKAVSQLEADGRLAFLMPLEFLSAGYGAAVKEVLLRAGGYLHFIRVDNEREVFADVVTSVGMVLFQKRGAAPVTRVRFSVIDRCSQFDRPVEDLPTLEWASNELQGSHKWGICFDARSEAPRSHLVPLSDYGKFKRGIATGANEFFVVRPADFERLGLPDHAKILCITKSSQINSRVFDHAAMQELLARNEPVILVNLEGERDGAIDRYIEFGESSGYSERYLTRMRRPWYRLEARVAPALLFGVFSRGSYKIVLNSAGAITLTPFHGFYPNLIGATLVNRIWLYLSSRAGRMMLESQKRTYGRDLNKFEPNDLNQVLVPDSSALGGVPDCLIEGGRVALMRGEELPAELERTFLGLLD